MAKGSGGTRSSNRIWQGTDNEDDLYNAGLSIFKSEARAGLGNFVNRRPQYVSDLEYDRLLKSGEYIEVTRGERKKEYIDQFVNGKYRYNTDRHTYGFGYYFAKSDSSFLYGNQDTRITGLVRKKDVIGKAALEQYRKNKVSKYIGDGKLKNGETLSDYDARSIYNFSTAAARKGYKVFSAENTSGYYVVIDRSALIIRKK